ncbi:chromosome partitioning protein ParB [Nodularia harveyana UHCC-0300]|uniref:Chromosome partitioning protein ParB n=1 Tax=Nodularia harveyana UHCC-0300 TaxID=2974287 RepID=A0ABU5U9Q5_9CYAN|nr:chromosome partitioning protein ParB [Nodularia harveyana]MEA5579900.1 chromosome partitioning protein ParB [Nodularia harveyana UHCC-0300]
MIKFSLLDVKSITSDIPRSNFAEADLENLADMILESGGIIKPLVVKVTGVETYSVIEGHFEYYGAVRAKEKNPRKGEMVNACVISPKEEDSIIKQASAIKGIDYYDKPINLPSEISGITKVELRLTNLELRVEKQINELKSELLQDRQSIDSKLKKIETETPKQIAPLEIFNNCEPSQLVLKLINAGFNQKAAEKVATSVDKESKNKKFDSLTDVIERVKIPSGKKQIRGITPEKMVVILDIWSRI